MKLSLKQLLDTEIPYQARLVADAEKRVVANPIRNGETWEETQEYNTYPANECIDAYFTQLARLETLKAIKVKESHEQMQLLKEAENYKSQIAFWRKIVLPQRVYTKTIYDANRNAVVTKHVQFQHNQWNQVEIDKIIVRLEVMISTLQQQINRLNTEKFVEVPDRV